VGAERTSIVLTFAWLLVATPISGAITVRVPRVGIAYACAVAIVRISVRGVPVMVRGAMGRNPFPAPPAPMPGNGMKAPTATAPHLDDIRWTMRVCRRREWRGCRRECNGAKSDGADHCQNWKAHLLLPNQYSGPKTFDERYWRLCYSARGSSNLARADCTEKFGSDAILMAETPA